MSAAADLHRARAAIAQADATRLDRLTTIRDHATAVSLACTPLVLGCVDLLRLAREERAKGVDLLPEASALQLFDLVLAFMDEADHAAALADRALIAERNRLRTVAPVRRAA